MVLQPHSISIHCLLFLFFAVSILNLLLASPITFKRPQNPNPKKNLSFINKAAIAAGVLGGGYVIKQVAINGPTFSEVVDMEGKVIVITGGNTGLGKETAVKLASLGSKIYILCRDKSKGELAVEDIKRQSKRQNIEFIACDLNSLESVKDCAHALHEKTSRVDIIINNAGVMAIPTRTLTKDGFEAHMGINHLGHFALLANIIDLMKGSKDARIVTVSSAAHQLGNIDRNNLMLDRNNSYNPWLAYGNSKLANILFTKELSKRLKASNNKDKDSFYSSISTFCLHPGACRTELGRYIVDPATIPKYLLPIVGAIAFPLVYFTKSPKQGAQTQIYLAASSKVTSADSGEYFDNNQRSSALSNAAKDDDLAAWLWNESENLTKTKFPF